MAHSQVLHYYNKVGRPLQRVDGPIGALLGKLLLCEVLANIDSNSHDDDKALHDVSVRRVDVHELQSDLHQLEDQHADEDAGDSADTAGGGDAADGRSCDSVQLIALSGVDGGAAGLAASRQPARPNMQEARM